MSELTVAVLRLALLALLWLFILAVVKVLHSDLYGARVVTRRSHRATHRTPTLGGGLGVALWNMVVASLFALYALAAYASRRLAYVAVAVALVATTRYFGAAETAIPTTTGSWSEDAYASGAWKSTTL